MPATQESRRRPDGKDGKTVKPWHLNGTTWFCGAGPDLWLLYQEAEALGPCAGRWVLVTEGESCADVARGGGAIAVTPPGHAHSVEQLFPCFQRFVGRLPLGLLLEHVGHKEARRVPDGWRLAELLMAPGPVVPAGADQIAAQGGDELPADLGGGGHGCLVMLQRFLAPPPGLGAFMAQP